MSSVPTVSVLMPVYNAALYVEEAIRSILNQTFTDFELIIFNDGSTDASSEIISSIKDERILFLDNKENQGYVSHLNHGLRIAKGKYIARMDADDIALPERFAKQIALLDNEPSVGLCGTAYQMFGSLNTTIQLPLTNQALKEYMLEHCPMGHPTVMFRKQVIEEHDILYDKDFMPAEDYKMWYEISLISELRNLPEVLLNYRVHPHQISSYQSGKQLIGANAVRVMQLTDKGFILTSQEQELYCQLLNYSFHPTTASQYTDALKLINNIISQNNSLKAYDSKLFVNIFSFRWHRIICDIKRYSPEHIAPVLLKPKLFNELLTGTRKIAFILKALIFWQVK